LRSKKQIIVYCTRFNIFYALGCMIPLRKAILMITVVTCIISKIILFKALIAIIIISVVVVVVTYSLRYFLVPNFFFLLCVMLCNHLITTILRLFYKA